MSEKITKMSDWFSWHLKIGFWITKTILRCFYQFLLGICASIGNQLLYFLVKAVFMELNPFLHIISYILGDKMPRSPGKLTARTFVFTSWLVFLLSTIVIFRLRKETKRRNSPRKTPAQCFRFALRWRLWQCLSVRKTGLSLSSVFVYGIQASSILDMWLYYSFVQKCLIDIFSHDIGH